MCEQAEHAHVQTHVPSIHEAPCKVMDMVEGAPPGEDVGVAALPPGHKTGFSMLVLADAPVVSPQSHVFVR